VAEGLTNAEIGSRLYLGAETVKTYLRQAFSKLGFRNRVQAATYVVRSASFARRGGDGH
jgi:DNA-binding NarL/FixJ family response regulator